MKKPAKIKLLTVTADDAEAEQAEAEQVKADALRGLCDWFVDSTFYKKVMTHPGYLREEAIRAEVVGLSDLT